MGKFIPLLVDERRRIRKGKSHCGGPKGQVPWNKGKHGIYSDKTLEKKRKAMLGHPGWNKGKHYINDKAKQKIAETNAQRVWTEESRKKLSESKIGPNNGNWQDGKSYEPYSIEWNERLKQKIRERDNYTCQICNNPGNNVHHIDYDKRNCNPVNLITLCRSHNLKVNSHRKKWQRLLETKIAFKLMIVRGEMV